MQTDKIDLSYICTVIGNLAGIPIRLYHGKELLLYHSVVPLPKDPACVYMDKLMAIDRHIGYLITQHFNYYGVVTSGETRIVLGPTRQMAANAQDLRALAFRADVPKEQAGEFVAAMKTIVSMPLESIIQILLAVNHILNGEKLGLADVTVYDAERPSPEAQLYRSQAEAAPAEGEASHGYFNNSLAFEQTLLNIVRHGDTEMLRHWVAEAPAVNAGILAKEQVRQQKNMLIVSVTLVCRAAIRGGMDMQDALQLSDSYIQACELLNDYESINSLAYRMVLDYTERVEKLRRGASPSKLVLDVRNYIVHHLSEPIRTAEMAEALFISRSKLSTRFKEETGENLCDFILREKAEEAKHLLRYTDKPLVAIGDYLGFSSQSHFTRTFKKFTGLTPAEYRARNQ